MPPVLMLYYYVATLNGLQTRRCYTKVFTVKAYYSRRMGGGITPGYGIITGRKT